MKSLLLTYALCPLFPTFDPAEDPFCTGITGDIKCLGCPFCVQDSDEIMKLVQIRIEMLGNNDPDILDPDHVYGPDTIWTCCICNTEFPGGRAAYATCPACETINLFGGGYAI